MNTKTLLFLALIGLLAYYIYKLNQKVASLQTQQNSTDASLSVLSTTPVVSTPTTATSGTNSGSTSTSSFDPSAYYQSLLIN